MSNTIQTQNEQKHVGKAEFILYLMGVFFLHHYDGYGWR